MSPKPCILDCEYGDGSSGCEGIHSSVCYFGSNADLCCNTCHGFQTNISSNDFVCLAFVLFVLFMNFIDLPKRIINLNLTN